MPHYPDAIKLIDEFPGSRDIPKLAIYKAALLRLLADLPGKVDRREECLTEAEDILRRLNDEIPAEDKVLRSDVLLETGLCFLVRGRVGNARLEFEEALKSFPQNLRARAHLAELLESRYKETSRALEYVLPQVRAGDRNWISLLVVSRSFHSAGEFDRAIKYAKMLAKTYPYSAAFFGELFNLHFEIKNFFRASYYFKRYELLHGYFRPRGTYWLSALEWYEEAYKKWLDDE